MKINIRTIEHKDQRYPTSGDWQFKNPGELTIDVSQLKDDRYSILVAFHELVEALLCDFTGVSSEVVDKWDIEHPELDEPGDSEEAPYYQQHKIALMFEQNLAQYLVVDWDEYEKALSDLYE